MKTRREFLGQLNCASVGSLGIYSSLLNLSLTKGLSASTGGGNDYKALVCVFLAGGNDSYNMLFPNLGTALTEYLQNRGPAALENDGEQITASHHPLTDFHSAGADLGYSVHPSMEKMAKLFNGDSSAGLDPSLSFVANVGSLVQPIQTRQDYLNRTVDLPKSLFSHNDQIGHWHTAQPQNTYSQLDEGWIGKMAEVIQDTHRQPVGSTGALFPINYSLNGNNLMQTGSSAGIYSIGNDGAASFLPEVEASDLSLAGRRKKGAIEFAEANHKNLFKRVYAEQFARSQKFADFFNEQHRIINQETSAVDQAFGNVSDRGDFDNKLRSIAKTIASADNLGQTRQTFFVVLGGWDTHSNLSTAHTKLLTALSEGLFRFQNALRAIGKFDNVATYTCSDFGRTLRVNGSNGTDHGWGGNQLVMGGAIDGGKVFGTYPSLATGDTAGSRDTGNSGRLIPSIGVDLYYRDLASWMGVSNGDMSNVLPNINDFSGEAPLNIFG